MQTEDRKMREAAESLGRILEELRPYIRRSVVEDVPRKGQWLNVDEPEVKPHDRERDVVANHGYS